MAAIEAPCLSCVLVTAATSSTDHSGHSAKPNRLLQKEHVLSVIAQAIVPLSVSPISLSSKRRERIILEENIMPIVMEREYRANRIRLGVRDHKKSMQYLIQRGGNFTER